MQNEAQKALNKVIENSCPERTNCKSCNISNRCNALMKDEVDIIQQLINCQFTKSETDTLLHVYKKYCEERNVPFVSDSEVVKKLIKQKEMWEED